MISSRETFVMSLLEPELGPTCARIPTKPSHDISLFGIIHGFTCIIKINVDIVCLFLIINLRYNIVTGENRLSIHTNISGK